MEDRKALNDEELQAVAGGVTNEEFEEAFNQPKPELCPFCYAGIGEWRPAKPWILVGINTWYGEVGIQWKCQSCKNDIVIGKSGKVYVEYI